MCNNVLSISAFPVVISLINNIGNYYLGPVIANKYFYVSHNLSALNKKQYHRRMQWCVSIGAYHCKLVMLLINIETRDKTGGSFQ